jgi:hypothetical protein
VANVSTEKNARNDGIADVVLKMKWYSSLSQVILNDKHEKLVKLRNELRDKIVDFYTTILSYVIKCTCATYNGLTQIPKDMLKLDGWENILLTVQDKEIWFRNVISDYSDERKISYLELLADMHRSTADDKIMRKLFVINMKTELQSLQSRKDDLIPESFNWILDHPIFLKFADQDNDSVHRRLWIKGKAGMGKTMLLIGVVQKLEDELGNQQETRFNPPYLSYFFCQGTNEKLNTATAVLRGLIWMLLRQDHSLIQHARVLSEQNIDDNLSTFADLRNVFLGMLKSPIIRKVFLVVDALDECIDTKPSDGIPGRSHLLDLISLTSKEFPKVKWLLSSRDEFDIEMKFSKGKGNPGNSLQLELNSEVLARPVEAYIVKKMSDLEERYIQEWELGDGITPKAKKIICDTLGIVTKKMKQKAGGTFLWVYLVFHRIKDEETALRKLPELVDKTPEKLEEIYDKMRRQIETSKDGNSSLCKKALSTATVANRPLRLSELQVLGEIPDEVPIHKIVKLCRFFRVAESDDNHKTVYIIHESAKQWLENQLKEGFLEKGEGTDHLTNAQTSLAKSCLRVLRVTLKKDVWNLGDPGIGIKDIQPRSRGKAPQTTDDSTQDERPLNTVMHAPVPEEDPLVSVTYAVLNWFDHISEVAIQHDESLLRGVSDFMRNCFLYWLEALSLLHQMGKGATITLRLHRLFEVSLI